ncbi:unnamed protein product [Chrysoparadoxa australica]
MRVTVALSIIGVASGFVFPGTPLAPQAIVKRTKSLQPCMALAGNFQHPTGKHIYTVKEGDKAEDAEEPSWAHKIVYAMLDSPMYDAIREKARDMMVQGAEKRGLDWNGIVKKIELAMPWEEIRTQIVADSNVDVPEYYFQPFHAYLEGNLCWQAAFEQEVASIAVGIRSFPKLGALAEEKLRSEFKKVIAQLGAQVEEEAVIVDFGCGTGTSSRCLLDQFPQAGIIIGLDLSPHMLAVGQHLNKEKGDLYNEKISLQYQDAGNSNLPDGCASLVNVCFLVHEMPNDAYKGLLKEAQRLLKPGGTLTLMDMDPQAPGYVKLQKNPLLYSIVRSTEPFLDEWFEAAPQIQEDLYEAGFAVVRKAAVTGRHSAVVATKAGSLDLRPAAKVRASMDEHLQTWET